MDDTNVLYLKSGWCIEKLGELIFQIGIVAFSLLVILALSAWLDIGLITITAIALITGAIVMTIGYRLSNGKWTPRKKQGVQNE